MYDSKMEEYLAAFSLGQNMDSNNPILDWKEVAIDGIEDMIVNSYISELGAGSLSKIGSLSITNSASSSDVQMFEDHITEVSRSEIRSISNGFISNLTSSGYYGILFKRFINFATVCEELDDTKAEKLTQDLLVKAFSQWLIITLVNYIVIKNSKYIQAAIAKINRESAKNQ